MIFYALIVIEQELGRDYIRRPIRLTGNVARLKIESSGFEFQIGHQISKGFMSDTVSCDCCQKLGKRQRFYPAPNDWYFIETTIEQEIVYVYACCDDCIFNIWKKGPGKDFKGEAALLPL